MLNTLQKIIIFSLAISINSVYGQSDEIKRLSIKDALDLSAENIPGSTSKFHENEIKCAYYNWIYYINRLKILTEKKALYNDLIKISGLKFKAGEINLAEKALAELKYLKIELQSVETQYNLLISENDLKRILLIPDDLLPVNDSLIRYDLPSDINSYSVPDTLNIYDSGNYMLHKNYDNLKIKLIKYDEQITFYKKVLKFNQQTISAIKLRYKGEDIEYSDYINIINEVLNLKLEYLMTLNLYNQTALKIESYFN